MTKRVDEDQIRPENKTCGHRRLDIPSPPTSILEKKIIENNLWDTRGRSREENYGGRTLSGESLEGGAGLHPGDRLLCKPREGATAETHPKGVGDTSPRGEGGPGGAQKRGVKYFRAF